MPVMVIIPARNEEVSIGSMVIKAKKYANHVLVVDDGSVDDTAEIARLAGADVISHSTNMGKGQALKTGFYAAFDNGTKIIVTIDADGQHDPDEIPKVIAPILSTEADMVIGSRYLNGSNIPFIRRIGQMVLDHMTSMNSGMRVTDTQSGFRAFDIDSAKKFSFGQNGFSIESEMLTEAASAGLKIKEVDIGVRYDVDCSTENAFIHGLKVLVHVLQDMEFRRPLYYFTFPGLIMGTIGLGMGLIFLQDFYNGGRLRFGPTLVMALLTLVGTFMAFTGIILHSISRLVFKNK
jgi:glycosyltransferase involved in cell wall biosynthesis